MDFTRVVNKSEMISRRISCLRNKKNLSNFDYRRLAILRAEFLKLNPAGRFIWMAGRPVIDLFRELSRPMM